MKTKILISIIGLIVGSGVYIWTGSLVIFALIEAITLALLISKISLTNDPESNVVDIEVKATLEDEPIRGGGFPNPPKKG
tara:strand:- start:4492 stop:4731 length:240 start_codon:yes stop_codon:yes gene_type:complete